MKRLFIHFLNDILNETINIRNFLKGVKFNDFIQNDEKIYAVCRSFEIIGEASKQIPKEIQDKFVEHYSQLMGIIDFSTFIDDQTNIIILLLKMVQN